MALDLQAIHEALADQIRASPLGEAFNVTAFSEPGTKLPRIEVRAGLGYIESYFSTFGPDGTADLKIDLVADLGGLTGQDRALWAWRLMSVGDNENGDPHSMSLVDVVHADRSFGGVVQDAVILSADWDDELDRITFPVWIIIKKTGAAV